MTRRSTATAPKATRAPAQPTSVIPRAATARRASAGPEHAQYSGNIATDLAPIPESPTLEGHAPGVVSSSHLGSNPAAIVSESFRPEDAEGSPVVRRFLVLAEKNISHSGVRSILREGKEIDENNYDIGSLQRQGVKLREITEQAAG